ncbi:MAG: hypothetical protein K2J04_09185, partial [Lachnospiraceae bacterium]|nr:hypothetical protein [Lachnospiraceae bacterium]
MIKRKVMIILIIAMVMMSSLMACQQTEGTLEETADEITVEAEISAAEQETAPQESSASLEFITDSPEYKA